MKTLSYRNQKINDFWGAKQRGIENKLNNWHSNQIQKLFNPTTQDAYNLNSLNHKRIINKLNTIFRFKI